MADDFAFGNLDSTKTNNLSWTGIWAQYQLSWVILKHIIIIHYLVKWPCLLNKDICQWDYRSHSIYWCSHRFILLKSRSNPIKMTELQLYNDKLVPLLHIKIFFSALNCQAYYMKYFFSITFQFLRFIGLTPRQILKCFYVESCSHLITNDKRCKSTSSL